MHNREVNLIFHNKKNFGDMLSPYIVRSLMNDNIYLHKNTTNIKQNLIAIGSYLHKAKNNTKIWGTGVRTIPSIEGGHDYYNLKVFSVRGPITRNFLLEKKIEVPEIFGDPALLLSKIYKPSFNYKLFDKIAIIPHYTNYNNYYHMNLSNDFILINPLDNYTNIIDIICSCKTVISSSLHGLIVSDAYNKQNIWLNEFPLNEGTLKFNDYYLSQNREIQSISNINEFFKTNISINYGNKINLNQLQLSFPFEKKNIYY